MGIGSKLSELMESSGTNANELEEKNTPLTMAAHFDGTEYTEEELEEIRQFAEFVKKRKSKS